MDFIGIIKDGGLSFATNTLHQRARYLNSLKNGQSVKESIVRARKPKSNEQIGTIFGLIIVHVCQEMNDRGETIKKIVMGDEYEVLPTKDNVKQFLYDRFAPNDDNGRQKTLSQMDMQEVSEFIDACLVGMAKEPYLIYIPDPDPNWRKHLKG